MPTITLTNNTTLSLTASSADDNATLNRYLKQPMKFLVPGGFEAIADQTVSSLNEAAFPLTAKASGGGTFAVTGSCLDVQLGAIASIGLASGVVSFEVEGTLSAGPTFTTGDFSFGVTKGASVGLISNCTATGEEKFGDAVKRAIAGLTIPQDIDDLRSLPVGATCEIDASSSLQFTANVTYSFFNNPLATASISNLPSFTINATAAATHAATATHTAEHTVTISKLPDGLLHLAVNLGKTDDFATSLTVSTGVTAGLGSGDALGFLLGKISPNATEEMAKLSADMPADQAAKLGADIKGALDSALSNSLQASLKAALDHSKSVNRLFLYEIDLTALDHTSTAALQSALRGNFAQITASAMAGIREIDSALTTVSTITHGLTLHLLGIFNWQSMNTFIQKSVADYTKDTHEIVLSDETIKVVTDNLDTQKLREVLVKGITLTLPASANTPEAATPINVVFFDRKAATDSVTMRQFANVLQATGSPNTAALNNHGPSSLSLGLNLNPTQCKQLFVDGEGKSLEWTYYLNHACEALAVILTGCTDTPSLGRLRLFQAGQGFWELLADAGSPANQLPLLTSRGIGEAALVDVTALIWWSSSMEKYSKAVAANESLIGIGKEVVKDSTRGFNEPWLVLAIWNMLGKPALTSLYTT